MTQEKITLYKMRDFSAKVNITIEYIRHNFLPLVKVVLLVVAPIALILTLLMKYWMGDLAELQNNPGADPFGTLSRLGPTYLLSTFISITSYTFLFTAVYGYMKMNQDQEEAPSPVEVYKLILPKLPMVFILMILISVVSLIGLVFFIIPGLYLMITTSLAVPIYLFENKNIGDAFGKSFTLIKGKWWSTFGLLIITGIISALISYLFAVPLYGKMIIDLFSKGADQVQPDLLFTSWYSTFALAFMLIGSYIAYLIPVIALSFQYFNLSERVEARGLRNQIKGFETLA